MTHFGRAHLKLCGGLESPPQHIHTRADRIPGISPEIHVKYVDLVTEYLPWFLLREQIQ